MIHETLYMAHTQANEWEPTWHQHNDTLTKTIHKLLEQTITQAARDTDIYNTYAQEEYNKGLKLYAHSTIISSKRHNI